MSEDIQMNDVEIFFEASKKKDNDKVNKKREIIVANLIQNTIPEYYFETMTTIPSTTSTKWCFLKEQIRTFLALLCEENGIVMSDTTSFECNIKGGRKKNYDFEIIINNIHIFKVEWKYGIEKVIQAPQFYSPSKPSNYLPESLPFEEWFYDNYLENIVKHPVSEHKERPDKSEYINNINNNKVLCMEYYSELYKTNREFSNHCKKEDKKAIKEYIQLTYGQLNIEKLSKDINESQKGKIYMLCKNGKIKMEKVNPDLYQLTKVIATTNTDYICKTKTGMRLRVKLRFKNGCGLKFPAFQIDRVIPKVKELKALCDSYQLIYGSKIKKDELIDILDNVGVIY